MKLPRVILAVLLLLAFAAPARSAVLFSEGFANNSQGWSLGPEWQIGPATESIPSSSSWGDPGNDHSPSSDNGVAGAIIGGSIGLFVHAPYTLTSPAVDIAAATSPVSLSYWRWLNSDYEPFMVNRVEVWDGTAWVQIWATAGPPAITDNAWTFQSFDVSAYKNAEFRVRFSYSIGSGGALQSSGWNLDDVQITSAGCPEDLDGDGFQSVACGGTDCNDMDPTVYPGATEVCDGQDNDCDGIVDESAVDALTWYQDLDGDGFGNPAVTQLSCTAPPGYSADNSDCDDNNVAANPNAIEVCDGVDNDCDGFVDEENAPTWYQDGDGDGWGGSNAVVACSAPAGYVENGGDCDDANAAIHPAAAELLDGIDNNCNGQVDEGFENPMIRSVRDVPNDQGRAVRVRWRKDLREQGAPPVTSYTLYRKVGPGQALARMQQVKPELNALPPGDWDVLTTIPATTADSTYQTVVATLCDSTSAGVCWSVFVVRAFTNVPGLFYDSMPDSGWSVDNIAPGVPQGLLVTVSSEGKQLSWQPSSAADFQFFRIYRGSSASFTPSPSNLAYVTATTSWSDGTPGSFTYKVTAVDANGNESSPAAVSSTTGVGDPMPTALAFASIAPNPFRGAVAFVIDVPQGAGAVSVAVYDLAGRRVRTLADGSLPAGRHTLSWNGRTDAGDPIAPGVYLVRLIGAGRTFTRRVTMIP